jgi:ABC-type branched-subunit amino acid transport system ATPase component/branched-subunit amino acid ABC-type transport system permease component
MHKFLELLVSGVVTGAIYSLIAAGLNLTYATTGIFNFAYGAIAYVCAVTYFEFNTSLHWPIVPAAIFTLGIVAPALGAFLNFAVFRRLVSGSAPAKVVVPIGLMIALPAAIHLIIDLLVSAFGVHLTRSNQLNSIGFPSGIGPVPRVQWKLPGGAALDSNELALICAAVVVAIALWYIMRHTHVGLRMRATVDSRSLATLRGIDGTRTSRTAWVIGCELAGLAGVLGAPVLGSLNSSSFVTVQFVASAAAVLGGFTSIPLAALGGIILGVAQNLVFGYATFASSIQGFNTSVPFALLLIGLAVLARERRRLGGIASDGENAAAVTLPFPRWFSGGIAVLFLIWLFVLANHFWVGIATTGLALALVMLSFVVVTGLGGMVSLAQATFVMVAGLSAGLAIDRWGIPFIPATMLGVAVAVVLGILVALPALWLGGLPLALATLALAFVGDNVLFQWNWFRNGESGWAISPPKLGFINLAHAHTLALVMVIIVVLAIIVVRNLERSASGRAILAVRASSLAASTSGLAPARAKLLVFATSAGLAGLGGIMLATYSQSITNVSYPATVGLLWLAQVVLFGVRRPGTAVTAGIVGAMFPQLLLSGFHWWSWVPTWLSWHGTGSPDISSLLFGLGAVAVAQDPNGWLAIYATMLHRRARWRTHPVPAGAVAAGPVAPAAASRNGEVVPSRPSAVSEPAALEIRQACAGYGDVQVLHDIDLRLRRGAVNVLLGPNGSGKTTLCRMTAGLIPVSRGALLAEGADLSSLASHRRSVHSGIMLVPQDRGVFPGLTVNDNLRVWLRDREMRAEAYERFPALAQRGQVAAGSLSGGEQQQLSLASMVVRTPTVLLVDEPTLGLAPAIAASVLRTIRALADTGVTVLLVEEKPRAVLDIADEVALLSLGRIVWSGPRSEVTQERIVDAYLGAADLGELPVSPG